MENLSSKIESILFISGKPMSAKKLSELVGAKEEKIAKAIDEIIEKYNNQPGSGIKLNVIGSKYQFVTSPENSQVVQEFLKEEVSGELTRPSLETLSIIAYRGPMTKAEMEQIRGVNCSLILRNLMIRGLVEEIKSKKGLDEKYQITFDFLKFLGISQASELPNYEALSQHKNLTEMLEQADQNQTGKDNPQETESEEVQEDQAAEENQEAVVEPGARAEVVQSEPEEAEEESPRS